MSSLANLKIQIKPYLPEKYFAFDTAGFDQMLKKKPESFWQKLGEQKALDIFHMAAKNVPAYKDFLKKHKVNPDKIQTYEDFLTLPLTDKKNYINVYSLKDRSITGEFAKLIAMSSGTSGEAKFWPRTAAQEFEAAIVHELIYKNSFQIHKSKTLLLIGFPMGVYVSGIATTLASYLVSLKYDLTVVSVGNNKTDMLKVLREAGSSYDQVVLVGHPFFIKDVLETEFAGLNLKKIRLRLLLCSEGFSEEWRDFVLRLINSKNPADIISVYGSSEMLLMGYETDLTIRLRRQISKSPGLLQAIWGSEIVPNIFQYNPFLRFVETVNQELVFTSASGLPLIRFNLHDHGLTLRHSELRAKFKDLPFHNSWQLPFVALWGRSDQTLIFYAANIYPEHIQAALQHGALMPKLTGKFVMRKGELKNLDQFLEINLELNKGVKPSALLSRQIQKQVVETLSQVNMEYHFLQHNLQKDLIPKIKTWTYQSEKYFKPGLKPKYILK